jgi:regulatory protein
MPLKAPTEDQDRDSDEASDVPTKRMLAWARNSAGYRLGQRMMTEKQLADAIMRKARQKFEDITDSQAKALAEAAVTFGRDVSALDDTQYASVKTRSELRNGRSKRMIAQRLGQKGVAAETVAIAVENIDDLPAAVAYCRRRAFGPFRKVEFDDTRKAKELSALSRQGFGFDLCKSVIALGWDEAEEILQTASF